MDFYFFVGFGVSKIILAYFDLEGFWLFANFCYEFFGFGGFLVF